MTGTHKRLDAARTAESRECSKCGEIKTWKFSHRTSTKAVYKDEKDRTWNAAVCPPCFSTIVYSNTKIRRIKEREAKLSANLTAKEN